VLASLDAGETQRADDLLATLTRHADLGRHLVEPWRVVVAGAVNAGKSSLVNALVGYQRSIVTPIPGTTRDVVTVRLAVDGWPIELADTAGLRDDADQLEQQGIQLSTTAVQQADLRLWILDATTEPLWPSTQDVLLVVNKIDQPAVWDLNRAGNAVQVSALTGAGLPELLRSISSFLVPEPPAPGAALPFTPYLSDGVTQARQHLLAGRFDEARSQLSMALHSSSGT